jgi:indole-3-glycerol phosphate synthase
MTVVGGGLLDAIVAAVQRGVAERRVRVPFADLAARVEGGIPRTEAFERALTRSGGVRVIAECKRRSPSRGVLRRDYDPAVIARAYERAGAAAISVLTEPSFFDGALAHLEAVTRAVPVPVLRKDFVVDEYQVVEAAAAGASAVLLIVSALDGHGLSQLLRAADRWGVAALVEVHDAGEIAVAVDSGAGIIGVNNRNLRTLEVALETAARLVDAIPEACVAVAESGLRTGDQVARLHALGYDAFLVGERFMSAADPGAAAAAFIDEATRALSGLEPAADGAVDPPADRGRLR